MIPRDIVDSVFAAAKIDEVVGEYVSLKRRGANLIGLCPFHTEKTGSFTVSPAKGIYKCFGCGKSGHAIGFVMEIESCGFAEAVRMVAKKYHIEIIEREQTDEEKQRQDDRESMFVANEFANSWFQNQLWNTEEGQVAGLQYFRERGLTDQTIREYGLGYSPEKGNPLAKALKQKGFVEKYIVPDPAAKDRKEQPGTGLCGKSEDGRLYDRFRGRVMFPIHTVSGKIVAFAGRIIAKKDNVGKYVNSPDSIIYSKTNELYGLFLAKQAIAREELCYLVEGQMDVISMHQAGIHNVVCSGGTALTRPQIQLIHRFTSNITVLYDGDAAGIHAALRGIDMFLEEGFSVKVVLLPDGEDPDSYAQSHNASDFIQYIHDNQTDFVRFKVRLLAMQTSEDPTQRANLIHDVVQSIAFIPDSITRQVYVQDAATQLGVAEALLTREVNRLRVKMYGERKKKTKYQPNAKYQSSASAPVPQYADSAPAEQPENAVEEEVIEPQQPRLETPKLSKVEENYRNLLQIIVRYGEQPLYELQPGNYISAADFIISQTQSDGLAPNPLFQRMIDEYRAHCQDDNFVAADFFRTHMDPEISQLAVALLVDDYQLSTMFNKTSVTENVTRVAKTPSITDKLKGMVPQLIMEYKYTLINQRLDELEVSLKNAKDNIEYQLQLLQTQHALLEYKNNFAKLLGNRVIT